MTATSRADRRRRPRRRRSAGRVALRRRLGEQGIDQHDEHDRTEDDRDGPDGESGSKLEGAPWRSGCSCCHAASATCPTGVSETITAAARTTGAHQSPATTAATARATGTEEDRKDDRRRRTGGDPHRTSRSSCRRTRRPGRSAGNRRAPWRPQPRRLAGPSTGRWRDSTAPRRIAVASVQFRSLPSSR